MPSPTKEGTVAFAAPGASGPCLTYYRIFGPSPSSSTPTPLVVLHGGPDLSSTRPVILNDQLGCGRSTHLRDRHGDAGFWTEALFRAELDNLIDGLDLRHHGFHLLGHSWGGMLASAYAATRPPGLRRLVVSNSPANMPLWLEAANTLRRQLPSDVQQALDKGERDGTVESDEYKAAVAEYYKRFMCRAEPWPAPEAASAMRAIDEDPTVYLTMNGPSEFYVTGSLKTWTVVDRLSSISVPTLLLNGRYDEAQDSCMVPFFENIAKVRCVTLENSSHMPFVEERKKYMQLVGNFFDQKSG